MALIFVQFSTLILQFQPVWYSIFPPAQLFVAVHSDSLEILGPGFVSRLAVGRLNNFLTGAHHQEPANSPYCCQGVFTNRSIFSVNLSGIQIPTGTSETNCNHKHGPMLTCRQDVDMFT